MTDPEKQAAKLLVFAEDPNLALFDELQELNATLKALLEKEAPPFPTFPEIPPFPEIPTVDFTQTNALLSKLAEKQKDPVEISVTLELI